MQMPIGAETELEGVIDLITMKEWVWKGEDLGASWDYRQDIRDDLADKADEMRSELMIEVAVEQDDDVDGAYLEGDEPDQDTLRQSDPQGHAGRCRSYPVLCGSAFKNKGVQPLLNAVIDFLPGPLDVPPYMGFKPGDEDRRTRQYRTHRPMMRSLFAGLAFKIMNDPFVGSLTFTRIYSGTVKKGDTPAQFDQGKRERDRPHDDDALQRREEIDEAFAGDIIALAGLKETDDGRHALRPRPKPVVLETMTFPDPVIEIAVEPKSKADQEKMGAGAAAAGGGGSVLPRRPDDRIRPDDHEGDGRACISTSCRSPEARVQGRSQYRRAAGRLSRDDQPRGRASTYTHKKQSGGSGQFARGKDDHQPTEAGRRLLVRKPDRWRRHAQGIHSGRRKGHPTR